MENYSGQYEASYAISVKSGDHRNCLDAYNRFKYLVKAFDFGNIKIFEHKSARKGDVLSRSLSIIFVGYAPDILAFKEAIDRILSSCNIFCGGVASVVLYNSEVTRKDARFNLIKQTS